MRCDVCDCTHNIGGYCFDYQFIAINDQGKCVLMNTPLRKHIKKKEPKEEK